MSEEAVLIQGVVLMLNNPTIEKLKDMKLKSMAQMMSDPDFSLRELTFEERFGIMVEKEWMSRKNSRIKRLLHTASLGMAAVHHFAPFLSARRFALHYLRGGRGGAGRAVHQRRVRGLAGAAAR